MYLQRRGKLLEEISLEEIFFIKKDSKKIRKGKRRENQKKKAIKILTNVADDHSISSSGCETFQCSTWIPLSNI
jgi:hypothetical protein